MKVDELFLKNAFDYSNENKQLFIDGLRETAKIHYKNNDFFRFLWDKNGFSPRDLQSEDDFKNMPYIMVNLFKHYELYSGRKEDIVLTLGSSGTSGQRSQIFLDQLSLDRVKTLAYKIHQDLGMTSRDKYNYICFTYDPAIAKDLGTAFTDELLTSFTGKNDVFYTFKHNGSDFYFDEQGTVDALNRFAFSPYSTRILGFPAFLNQILDKYDIQLELGEDSWVQTGGGWKTLADEEIPKEDFRNKVSQRLGLPKENVRDMFGMVEHGVPYVDCNVGKLRIPNFSRVLIRDPYTLEVKPFGEVGLIQFICHYNTSFPAMSLLTTDYGKVQIDYKGPFLEILGRAGISKNKGCALKALEMLS